MELLTAGVPEKHIPGNDPMAVVKWANRTVLDTVWKVEQAFRLRHLRDGDAEAFKTDDAISWNRKGSIMAQYKVDGYALRLWSSRSTTVLSPGTAVAGIYLYEGKAYRGYVYFFPDGTPLASPVYDATAGRVFLHLNLSQFHATMDLLRNESPIYVYYLSPTNAALRSGIEPVGEEE